MDIIVKPKGGGKTTELIRRSNAHNSYIVCINTAEAYRIADIASNMGCFINFPITFDEFKNNRYYAKGVRKFFIDNADILLQSLTCVPIEGMTITETIDTSYISPEKMKSSGEGERIE